MNVQVNAAQGKPDVLVVVLSGRLDVMGAEPASAALSQAAQKSAAGIIVDLHGVDFVSSAGLRALIAVRKELESASKKMALIHVHPSVYKIFKVSMLDNIFFFFEDEDEAIPAVWA